MVAIAYPKILNRYKQITKDISQTLIQAFVSANSRRKDFIAEQIVTKTQRV